MCGCLVAGCILLGVAWVLNAIFGFQVAVIGLLVVIAAVLLGSVD